MNEQQITIVGNLTNDPELRFTPNGAAVANLTVAFTPRRFDKNLGQGEWTDGEPTFWRCTAWRDLAEHIAESLQKGMRVIVTGRVRAESYDKNGEKRTVLKVDIDEIGPSLRFASAKVARPSRTSGSIGRQQADAPF